jgi:hypothetical protein
MDKAKGKDKRTFCWSCGKSTMQPFEGHYKCMDCGATWVDIPVPGKVGKGILLYETPGDHKRFD